jgi:hypothetical protein
LPLISFTRIAFATIVLAALTGAATAAPGLPTADPAALNAGTSATVRVTNLITDDNVLPAGVNVVRVDAAGRNLSTLGQMRDDGTNGDLVAGDRVFSGNVAITGASAGPIRVRVSAAIRGVLLRANSPILNIDVLPPGIPTRPSLPDPTKIVIDGAGRRIVSDEVLACFADGATIA